MFRFLDPGRLAVEILVDGAPSAGVPLRAKHDCAVETYHGNLGYRVDAEYRGHHRAERARRLRLPLARSHALQSISITCDPDSAASQRTGGRFGAAFADLRDHPPKGSPKCRHRLEL